MPDILIRNLSDEDLAMIDAHAHQLGLSRSEYIRRQLQQDARRNTASVSVEDLKTLADGLKDLADEKLMRDAWS